MEIPDPAFLRFLHCPLTGLGLEFIKTEALPSLGVAPEQFASWSGALLRADGRALFPVRSGIPVLLAEELRSVGQGSRAGSAPA